MENIFAMIAKEVLNEHKEELRSAFESVETLESLLTLCIMKPKTVSLILLTTIL